MNRDQINQLAQLALSTKDPDLLAKAVQELMAAKKAEALPLFDAQQPAVADAGVSASSLAAALDNLPPMVAKQAPVQRVELEAVVPKSEIQKPNPHILANRTCNEWVRLYGTRWVSNTEAFGANASWSALTLRKMINELIEAEPKMTRIAIGRLFWKRLESLHSTAYRVEHRVRDCGGYTVREHRILRVQS